MIEVKKNQICGVCPGGCIVDMTFEDGKLVSQSAAKDTPFGRICVRGKHAPEILYSKDRLTTPLIRVGEKGEGKFRKASWEEALDYTAAAIQAYCRCAWTPISYFPCRKRGL